MSEGYGEFSRLYDRALGTRFAEAIRPVLTEIFSRHNASHGSAHLDLAAGTSASAELFRDNQWRSTSVDASYSMLVAGRGRTERSVVAEMTSLPFRAQCFSLVTCIYDSLNHLLEEEDIRRCLSETSRVMRGGGLFVFDINHPRAYARIWDSDEPWEVSGDDWSMTIRTGWDQRSGIGRASITGSLIREDGTASRFREVRMQRAWNPDWINARLGECGFATLECFEIDPFRQLGEDGGTKVVYVARR